jgi:hypothetical protein
MSLVGPGEPEGHSGKLEESLMGDECRFVNILGGHRDLPIACICIHRAEILCLAQLVKDGVDAGYRVPVGDGQFVEGAEIYAKTPSIVFLLSEYDWGGHCKGFCSF